MPLFEDTIRRRRKRLVISVKEGYHCEDDLYALAKASRKQKAKRQWILSQLNCEHFCIKLWTYFSWKLNDLEFGFRRFRHTFFTVTHRDVPIFSYGDMWYHTCPYQPRQYVWKINNLLIICWIRYFITYLSPFLIYCPFNVHYDSILPSNAIWQQRSLSITVTS